MINVGVKFYLNDVKTSYEDKRYEVYLNYV